MIDRLTGLVNVEYKRYIKILLYVSLEGTSLLHVTSGTKARLLFKRQQQLKIYFNLDSF